MGECGGVGTGRRAGVEVRGAREEEVQESDKESE